MSLTQLYVGTKYYIGNGTWAGTVSQIPKNEPVNNQNPAAYLPIVLNNNKNNNKLSLEVKF